MTKILLILVVVEGFFWFRAWYELKKKRVVDDLVVDKLRREAAAQFAAKKINEGEMQEFLASLRNKK